MSFAENLAVKQPRDKLVKKVYLMPEVMDFVNEANEPSRMVNLACCHLKHTMRAMSVVIQRKFDAEEIESITEVFEREFKSYGTVYFIDIGEAREAIERMNNNTSHRQTRYWIKAVPILLRHCDLDEINCLVYMARFVKPGANGV